MYWENAAKVPLAGWYTIFFVIIVVCLVVASI